MLLKNGAKLVFILKKQMVLYGQVSNLPIQISANSPLSPRVPPPTAL
jgi:hypothetical protein